MKKLEIWKYAALFMAALCMTFTFAACEDLFGDDEDEEEQSEPQFSDYFTMSITRCERVGDVLILDWTIKNKSKKDAQNLTINMGNYGCLSTDDTGETYRYGNVRIGSNGSTFASTSRTTAVLAGETIQGTIRINSFNATNTATKFTLNVDVACTEMGVSETLEFKNIAITDNRVLSKGIQTNDTKLAYTVKSCKRDDDGNVILCFTVKNNTGTSLQDYKVSLNSFTDNLSSNCTEEISLTNNFSSWSLTTDIAAGETLSYYIKITNVNENATWVGGSIYLSSDNYEFECSEASFYNIAIQ